MTNRLELLAFARRTADFAQSCGFVPSTQMEFSYPSHLGAVMADSILQAGVNYQTVVFPRVTFILDQYPDAVDLDGVNQIIATGLLPSFLRWKHHSKIERFEQLAYFFSSRCINTTSDLSQSLSQAEFRADLLSVFGVGQKTIDYMACLVGLDHVAVDRHVRRFVERADVDVDSYQSVQSVVCYAADLMGSGYREFDSWIWQFESGNANIAKRANKRKVAS